jgi:hypothetical protein
MNRTSIKAIKPGLKDWGGGGAHLLSQVGTNYENLEALQAKGEKKISMMGHIRVINKLTTS